MLHCLHTGDDFFINTSEKVLRQITIDNQCRFVAFVPKSRR
ncbi:MAG: hypothetical protein ABI616_13675 [Pseudomonadota bacterium]